MSEPRFSNQTHSEPNPSFFRNRTEVKTSIPHISSDYYACSCSAWLTVVARLMAAVV